MVFLASKPLAIPGIVDRADALLCAFNPGEAGGTAVAEILFGDINPSGKLPVSFPCSAGQLPVYYNKYTGWHARNDESMGGHERYIDLPPEPLFAFGGGMSYTTFLYTDLVIETPELERPGALPGPDLMARVHVSNTGSRAGTTVVQLYIRDLVSSVTRPVKELRSFERVTLDAREERDVTLTVAFDELALVDRDLVRRVEPGEFDVMVGPSSRDAELLHATVVVK